MTPATNCPSLSEPWMSWLSDDALSLETQALTKALQVSLSSGNQSSSPSSPSSSITITQQPPPTSGRARARARNSPIPGPQQTAKVAKRRSRAKKRAATTYINADPANFRAMVQQMTGHRFGDHVVIRPEPKKQTLFQPSTLDSALGFFVDRVGPAGSVGLGPVAEQLEEEAPLGFDVDEFLSFPTLESWSMV